MKGEFISIFIEKKTEKVSVTEKTVNTKAVKVLVLF
jgi:hypothetical protein